MAAVDQARTAEEAVKRLEELGTALLQLGYSSRLLVQPGRVPCLHVRNPAPGATALAEDIYCAPRADGWHFWWSWAEPIAPDVPGAAGTISRVLRAVD